MLAQSRHCITKKRDRGRLHFAFDRERADLVTNRLGTYRLRMFARKTTYTVGKPVGEDVRSVVLAACLRPQEVERSGFARLAIAIAKPGSIKVIY